MNHTFFFLIYLEFPMTLGKFFSNAQVSQGSHKINEWKIWFFQTNCHNLYHKKLFCGIGQKMSKTQDGIYFYFLFFIYVNPNFGLNG